MTCVSLFKKFDTFSKKVIFTLVVLDLILHHFLTFEIVSPKWKAPEIMFDPSQIGLEYGGVQHLIDTSIGKSDIDLRRSLYGGIVLSGGSTMFQGFGDRLLYELRKLAQQKRQEVKIRIFAPSERK